MILECTGWSSLNEKGPPKYDCFQLLRGELKAVWCREDYRSHHIYGPALHTKSINNFHTQGGFTFPHMLIQMPFGNCLEEKRKKEKRRREERR